MAQLRHIQRRRISIVGGQPVLGILISHNKSGVRLAGLHIRKPTRNSRTQFLSGSSEAAVLWLNSLRRL